jgi:anti-sigma factor RsiW
MDKLSRLTPAQRSDLVAYLDGELDDQSTSEIESVLAHSTVARNDVELLARTYDLLDELPRVKATQEFTDRTLATIRMDDVRTDFTQTEWYQRLRRGRTLFLWTVAMIVASGAGYAVTRIGVPNPADMLVKDYDVIEELDVYRQVDNVEFLQELDRQGSLLTKIREAHSREVAH